jgi:hypothetical protein
VTMKTKPAYLINFFVSFLTQQNGSAYVETEESAPVKKFKSDSIYRPDDKKDSIGQWEPEPLVPQKSSGIREPVKKNSGISGSSENPAERVHSWAPPKIGAGEKVIRSRSVSAVTPAESSSALPANHPVIAADPVLKAAVIPNPELAVYRIRNWFFEKPGKSEKGIYSVSPHLRIYIVLSLLGAELIKVIYSIMSPTERRQIHQILKADLMAGRHEIEIVKTEFHSMILEDRKNK